VVLWISNVDGDVDGDRFLGAVGLDAGKEDVPVSGSSSVPLVQWWRWVWVSSVLPGPVEVWVG
jgi:hypothetical protein